MEAVVEVCSLIKKYRDTVAVHDVSFTVHKGEIFVIVGPNGAGKTTIVEICEGMRQADSGEVKILGSSPQNNAIKKKFGAQLEESQFDVNLKVREILEVYGSFYDNTLGVDEVLNRLDLSDKANSFYGKLSKGLKQRVSIGVAMIHDPELFFFDEISSGLDPEARRNIWELLIRIKNNNKSIILTTHYMEEAEYLADTVMIIDKGVIKIQGAPANLISNYVSTHKLEYWGKMVENIEGVKHLEQHKGKVILYTDMPDETASDLKKKTGIEDCKVSRINLEDVFFYYTSKGEK